MDRIRYFAEVSVRRACGFGLLAIFTVVIGLSSDLGLALRAAAILLSLLAAILLKMALTAERTPYRRREIWMLLDQWHGLPEHRAHHMISRVMREVFLHHAELAAWAAIVCWALGFSSDLFDELVAGPAIEGLASP